MKKLILDLDTGIDDTLALSYVLASSEEAELIGITGTYGNVLLETGIRNDLNLLSMYGRDDIPVFKGISHPSTANSFVVPRSSGIFHGENGVGNATIPADSRREASNKAAVDFIIESVHKFGDDLVYVPTGPSTNLDAALAKDPDIASMIHVVMMGGALTQPGNSSPYMEANVSMDPEATNRVFHSNLDLIMVGLDVTMQVLLTKKETQVWRDTGTDAGRFLADMTDYYIDISKQEDPAFQGGCNLHDPLAAAVAIDPSLVQTMPINLMVDTAGEGRGRTIGDPAELLSNPKRTRVALGVDAERFLDRFMSRLTALVK